MLKNVRRIQHVFQIRQIPKDIEGNEVQISSATSMLGRQLEDTEQVPVTFDDSTRTCGWHFAETSLFFEENTCIVYTGKPLDNPISIILNLYLMLKLEFCCYNNIFSGFFDL